MTNEKRLNKGSPLKKLFSSFKEFFSRANNRKQKLRDQQAVIEEQKKLIQQLQKSQTESEEQIRVLNERIEQGEKSQQKASGQPKKLKRRVTEVTNEKSSDFFPEKHGSRVQARIDFDAPVRYGMSGWSTKTIVVNVNDGEQGKADIQNAQSIMEGYQEEGRKAELRFIDLEDKEEISLERVLELIGE